MPFLATEYAAMCEPELGRVPKIACDGGVLIPITVDGVEVFEDPGNHACDNPDGLRGGCSPGSRLGHVEGRDAGGSPRPEVSWVYFCRSVGPENLEQRGWGSVQLIGYNRQSGATCFFEAADGRHSLPEEHPANSEIRDQRPWVSFDGHRMVGQMPGPDDPDFNDAFMPPPPADMNRDGEPDVVQCVQCHQSGPFIHDPFMDSARDPDDPSRPVMPEITGRDVPYYVVGGTDWDMRTIHIEGNRCLGCHSAPMEISQIFEAAGLEVNSFMPPHAPGQHGRRLPGARRLLARGAGEHAGLRLGRPVGAGARGRRRGRRLPAQERLLQPARREGRRRRRQGRRPVAWSGPARPDPSVRSASVMCAFPHPRDLAGPFGADYDGARNGQKKPGLLPSTESERP